MTSAIGVIPARYGSTRFPGKALAPLAGKPMIAHVYERACRARQLDRVIVATDDERIRAAVAAFGGEAVMTRPDHPSGTDRIAEVAAALQADLIVNLQGDEPLLPPEVIDAAITPLIEDPSLVMGTVTAPLTDAAEWRDPNIVKVVVDREGFALYFSRAPIPFPRDMATPATAWKHIGLYVYRRDFLLRFAALSPTILEETERLEQLRALEHGYRIKVVATAYDGIGVDTPADLARAEAMLAAQLKEKVNP